LSIDPHAWLLTAPLTLVLLQLALRPHDCVVKRWWRSLMEMEQQMWFHISRRVAPWSREPNPALVVAVWRGSYAFAIAAFAVTTLASFGVFIGAIAL
jgi:hypothetical protein